MRAKNVKLLQLEILNRRTLLTEEDSKDLNKYRLGHAGELQFDAMIAAFSASVVHMKDYRFQLESASVTGKKSATARLKSKSTISSFLKISCTHSKSKIINMILNITLTVPGVLPAVRKSSIP
ncbi:hypothetical protein [Lacicoccus qingdaonensis]|uniref:Uncharacterized protein n=1 Tax=Lacicoccus qingdaonensis TaxID=576118 RepID=A0A1G8ZYD0_9BACL|nr:hypothetical protein [Salinicoccus qingdaonensis]SDK20142.1 hypothetical protein SAMN05216216_10146 [Salinicoccus qingdaonensis]